MVDVLSGTANKKDWNVYYIKETFSLLQVAGLKKVINISPRPPSLSLCLIFVLLENESQ